MPKDTYKSAAVPFMNQKGERSMKRVKVERYVAGKKPAYAKDDDEEYYTTDDEDEPGDESVDEERSEEECTDSPTRKIKSLDRFTSSENDEHDKAGSSKWTPNTLVDQDDNNEEDDDDDDPRFRMLKQVEVQASSSRLLASQISTLNSHVIQSIEDNKVVIDEDEEEDEEEVKMRHALARVRALEEPIGPQVMLDEYADRQLIARQTEYESAQLKKEETDDILKDLKLTGIKPKAKKDKEDAEAQEKMKEMIDQARQAATFKAQLMKKIEEDKKRELAQEALDKGDIGANDIDTVKTDDEDEDIAYEEWKLREIKRVLRDRSERALETRAR